MSWGSYLVFLLMKGWHMIMESEELNRNIKYRVRVVKHNPLLSYDQMSMYNMACKVNYKKRRVKLSVSQLLSRKNISKKKWIYVPNMCYHSYWNKRGRKAYSGTYREKWIIEK